MVAAAQRCSAERRIGKRPRTWTTAARVTLLLNAIVLALCPVTEYFWTWDGFLRGGQDVELTVLAALALCCLILVMAHQCTREVALLLELRRPFAHGRPVTVASRALPVLSSLTCGREATAPVFGSYRALLQI